MQVKSNEHIVIFGKTQSGKSVLLKSLIPSLPRVIFHDRKHMNYDLVEKYHFSLANNPGDLLKALQKGMKRVLYQPTDPSTDDLNEVAKIVFDTGNITFCIDEASLLLETNTIPMWVSECYRLGMAKGIGVWALSQRSRYLANICVSEANHIVCFRLAMKSDREKVMQSSEEGIDEQLKGLPLYYYMWYNCQGAGEIFWCLPLKYKP